MTRLKFAALIALIFLHLLTMIALHGDTFLFNYAMKCGNLKKFQAFSLIIRFYPNTGYASLIKRHLKVMYDNSEKIKQEIISSNFFE